MVKIGTIHITLLFPSIPTSPVSGLLWAQGNGILKIFLSSGGTFWRKKELDTRPFKTHHIVWESLAHKKFCLKNYFCMKNLTENC